jgi:hypothetical protein
VPSEKRIRTLLQDLDGDALDVITGGWLRSLAAAAKPARPQDGPPEHIAVDGKWLRGVGDGPVKLFSALHHGDAVIIAQHRIPTTPPRPPRSRPCWIPWTSPGRSSPPTPPTPAAIPPPT